MCNPLDRKKNFHRQRMPNRARYGARSGWRRHGILFICAVLWSLSASERLHAQAPDSVDTTQTADAAEGPAAVRQAQPEFLVRAEVNHSTRQYREGDTFNLQVVSEEDAYVYVIYEQADGQVFQIYPNIRQPDNRLKAKQAVQIPARDDSFRWQIGAPFGNELVKVIASKEPIEALNAEQLRAKRFNLLPSQVLKGVEKVLAEEQAPAWTEVETPIITLPRRHVAEQPDKKRFGVFFGVAEHLFHNEVEAATGRGMNLASPHRDARQLADVLREVGQLDQSQVYLNDQATRKNLEIAVTEWLPSVSRPGDTVVIYYSGHGGTLDGPRKTHFLVPHDFFTLPAAAGLKKREDAGQIDAQQTLMLETARQLIQKWGPEKAEMVLTLKTGVSDVEFGHWLQRLDGRQVIVVLDICFAGGFATLEKDLTEEKTDPRQFQFLESQIVRLKDIGQPESALLASSRADQTSQVRREQDLSVMTFALIDSLRGTAGPITLEQAHQDCAREMQRYFTERNIPGHEPKLFNYCTTPAYLKP